MQNETAQWASSAYNDHNKGIPHLEPVPHSTHDSVPNSTTFMALKKKLKWSNIIGESTQKKANKKLNATKKGCRRHGALQNAVATQPVTESALRGINQQKLPKISTSLDTLPLHNRLPFDNLNRSLVSFAKNGGPDIGPIYATQVSPLLGLPV